MTLALRTALGSSDEQHGTATPRGSSQYRHVEELTGGGRAQLQVALSGDLGAADLVVIKRIAAPRTAAGLTELTEEIALARRLDHDAIARCRAIGFDAGSYFMVSDYLDGISLGVLLRAAALRGARLSNAVVARVLLAILNAVDYADRLAPSLAARALVHQTVTIEDVFLTLDGDVKILGFKGGRRDAAASGEAAAIDALLAGHLTRELALVLHHAVRPAPGALEAAATGAGERCTQLRAALQEWQARSTLGDGRAETARSVRAALPAESVERRARIAAARAAETAPAMISDEPPVSGMRPTVRAEQPAQPPPLPAPDPLDDDDATIAEPARQAELPLAPAAARRRRILPYALAGLGASTLVFAHAMRPPPPAPGAALAEGGVASAVAASAGSKHAASAPAASRTAPGSSPARVAPVSYRAAAEGPSSAAPALASPAAAPATKPAAAPAPVMVAPPAGAAAPAKAPATPAVAPAGVPAPLPRSAAPLPTTVPPAPAVRAPAVPAEAPSVAPAAAVTAFAGARPPATVSSESNAVPGVTSEKVARPHPGAPAPEGHLTLDSTPWSAVYFGGELLGQTPLVEAPLPAGDHALQLVNPDQGISTTYVVHIEGGKTTVRRVGLEKPGAPQ